MGKKLVIQFCKFKKRHLTKILMSIKKFLRPLSYTNILFKSEGPERNEHLYCICIPVQHMRIGRKTTVQ